MSWEERDITIFTGLSVDEANKFLEDRAAQYEKTADGYRCKKCGGTIIQTTLYISIHYKEFTVCAGSGEVRNVNFPYCPTCDGTPKIVRGCIHLALPEADIQKALETLQHQE